MSSLLLIILLVILIGVLPTWPYGYRIGLLPERGTGDPFGHLVGLWLAGYL